MEGLVLNNFSIDIINRNEKQYIQKVVVDRYNYFPLPDLTFYDIRLGNNFPMDADAHVFLDNKKVGIWRIPASSHITIRRDPITRKPFRFTKENSYMGWRNEGADVQNKYSKGLIRVVFKPEMVRCFNTYRSNAFDNDYNFNTLKCTDQTASGLNQIPAYASNSKIRRVNNSNKYHNISLKNEMREFNTYHSMIKDYPYVKDTNDNFSNNDYSAGTHVLGDRSSQTFRSGTVPKLKFIDEAKVTTLVARLVIDDPNKYLLIKKGLEMKDTLESDGRVSRNYYGLEKMRHYRIPRTIENYLEDPNRAHPVEPPHPMVFHQKNPTCNSMKCHKFHYNQFNDSIEYPKAKRCRTCDCYGLEKKFY